MDACSPCYLCIGSLLDSNTEVCTNMVDGAGDRKRQAKDLFNLISGARAKAIRYGANRESLPKKSYVLPACVVQTKKTESLLLAFDTNLNRDHWPARQIFGVCIRLEICCMSIRTMEAVQTLSFLGTLANR